MTAFSNYEIFIIFINYFRLTFTFKVSFDKINRIEKNIGKDESLEKKE